MEKNIEFNKKYGYMINPYPSYIGIIFIYDEINKLVVFDYDVMVIQAAEQPVQKSTYTYIEEFS